MSGGLMLNFLNKWKEAPARRPIPEAPRSSPPPVAAPAPAVEAVKLVKTVKQGALTPAYCHTPQCGGHLHIVGRLRQCGACGAEIELQTINTSFIREAARIEEPADHLNQVSENIEMHDSALFDVIVEVDFYDGRRIRIPQRSTPAGWASPF